MKYERLKENLSTIYTHNHTQGSRGRVVELTGGRKTESQVIDEIVYDCREILDKIEQGTLIELPCKVGDTVYVRENTWTWYNSSFNRAVIGGEFFVIGKITSIRITEKQILIKVKATYKENPYRYTKRDYPICAIGKTVFLTREEAEKRLKELQNG